MPNFDVKERETVPSTTTKPNDGPPNCPHAELTSTAPNRITQAVASSPCQTT